MILLDTHSWVWWAADRSQLSRRALKAIEADDELVVSSISCWEVATLIRKNRLTFDRDPSAWIEAALALPKIVPVALTPEIAATAGFLEGFHGDPADRILCATALRMNLSLVTKDRLLHDWPAIKTVW